MEITRPTRPEIPTALDRKVSYPGLDTSFPSDALWLLHQTGKHEG